MRIDKQKVCSNCPCFNLIDSYCNLTDTENELPCETVLPDCPLPLVSVPEIHGRLIDADRFLDWLNEFHPNDVVIMSGVKNARTVIEAEE